MSDDVIVVESRVKEIQGMKHGHLVVVEGTQTHKMRVGDRLLIHPAFYIVLKKGTNHAICQFEFRAIGYKQEEIWYSHYTTIDGEQMEDMRVRIK